MVRRGQTLERGPSSGPVFEVSPFPPGLGLLSPHLAIYTTGTAAYEPLLPGGRVGACLYDTLFILSTHQERTSEGIPCTSLDMRASGRLRRCLLPNTFPHTHTHSQSLRRKREKKREGMFAKTRTCVALSLSLRPPWTGPTLPKRDPVLAFWSSIFPFSFDLLLLLFPCLLACFVCLRFYPPLESIVLLSFPFFRSSSPCSLSPIASWLLSPPQHRRHTRLVFLQCLFSPLQQSLVLCLCLTVLL